MSDPTIALLIAKWKAQAISCELRINDLRRWKAFQLENLSTITTSVQRGKLARNFERVDRTIDALKTEKSRAHIAISFLGESAWSLSCHRLVPLRLVRKYPQGLQARCKIHGRRSKRCPHATGQKLTRSTQS